MKQMDVVPKYFEIDLFLRINFLEELKNMKEWVWIDSLKELMNDEWKLIRFVFTTYKEFVNVVNIHLLPK